MKILYLILCVDNKTAMDWEYNNNTITNTFVRTLFPFNSVKTKKKIEVIQDTIYILKPDKIAIFLINDAEELLDYWGFESYQEIYFFVRKLMHEHKGFIPFEHWSDLHDAYYSEKIGVK